MLISVEEKSIYSGVWRTQGGDVIEVKDKRNLNVDGLQPFNHANIEILDSFSITHDP